MIIFGNSLNDPLKTMLTQYFFILKMRNFMRCENECKKRACQFVLTHILRPAVAEYRWIRRKLLNCMCAINPAQMCSLLQLMLHNRLELFDAARLSKIRSYLN